MAVQRSVVRFEGLVQGRPRLGHGREGALRDDRVDDGDEEWALPRHELCGLRLAHPRELNQGSVERKHGGEDVGTWVDLNEVQTAGKSLQ